MWVLALENSFSPTFSLLHGKFSILHLFANFSLYICPE